jgi:hypothetical protein
MKDAGTESGMAESILTFVRTAREQGIIEQFILSTIVRVSLILWSARRRVRHFLTRFQREYGQAEAIMRALFPDPDSEVAHVYEDYLTVADEQFEEAISRLLQALQGADNSPGESLR